MSLVYPFDFNDETTLQKADLQSQFDAVSDKFSGGITDADIAANANISGSKLGTVTSTEHIEVPIRVGPLVDGWPNGSSTPVLLAAVPLVGSVYTVTGVRWVCNKLTSTGATAGIAWLEIDATGTLAPTWIIESLSIPRIGTSAYGRGYQAATTVLTAPTNTPGLLAVYSASGVDTNMLDDSTDSFMCVTVSLSRSITS